MSNRIMCAEVVTPEQLAALPDPVSLTPHHFPVRFDVFRNTLLKSVEQSGIVVTGGEIGLSEDHRRLCGIIDLDNFGTDGAQTMFSYHASHDMSLAIHLNAGEINKVCANMNTYGDTVRVSRKNTRFAMRDLPRMIDTAVSKLVDYRQLQNRRIECYQNTELSIERGDSIVLTALKKGIISRNDVLGVYDEWREPTHPEFAVKRNAYRLMQAFTESWKEEDGAYQLQRLTKKSRDLNGLLDGVCGVLNVEKEVELV